MAAKTPRSTALSGEEKALDIAFRKHTLSQWHYRSDTDCRAISTAVGQKHVSISLVEINV
jgi:hypothetical protein